MKRIAPIPFSLWTIIAALWLLPAREGHAQNFTVDHFVWSGGGGASSGGGYQLTGSIGHSTAAPPLAGGPFQLDPGFWSVAIAITTPDGPLMLTIRQIEGAVEISWPAAGSPGFMLEVASSLSLPVDWQPLNQAPMLRGSENVIALGPSSGNTFYRLRQAQP